MAFRKEKPRQQQREKATQNSTSLPNQSPNNPNNNNGDGDGGGGLLIPDDSPLPDLPPGVYILPPNAPDPSRRVREEELLEV